MAGRIGKGVASLIGLVQEAHAQNKEKKEAAALASSQPDSNLPPASISEDEVDEDDDDWIADDAQQQLHPLEPDDKEESIEQVVEWFKKRHPTPEKCSKPSGRLPAPVIVPQKRPDMRSRGFVRA